MQTGNRSATFVPPANAAYLIGDFTDWDERPLPLSKPLTLKFPEGAYVEYAFLDAHMRPFADPQNHQRPKYPWYEYHRAFSLPRNRFQEPPRPLHFGGTIVPYDVCSRFLVRRNTDVLCV
jgi:1,4-alpha-glucan branching enzyme